MYSRGFFSLLHRCQTVVRVFVSKATGKPEISLSLMAFRQRKLLLLSPIFTTLFSVEMPSSLGFIHEDVLFDSFPSLQHRSCSGKLLSALSNLSSGDLDQGRTKEDSCIFRSRIDPVVPRAESVWRSRRVDWKYNNPLRTTNINLCKFFLTSVNIGYP